MCSRWQAAGEVTILHAWAGENLIQGPDDHLYGTIPGGVFRLTLAGAPTFVHQFIPAPLERFTGFTGHPG